MPDGIGSTVNYRISGYAGAVYQNQILRVKDQPKPTYYIVLPKGPALIEPFTAQLLLADPQMPRAYGMGTPTAFEVPLSGITQAPPNSQRIDPAGYPEQIPRVVRPSDVSGPGGAQSASVCSGSSDTSGASTATEIHVGPAGPGAWEAPTSQPQNGDVNVVVPPGRAALIRPLAHAGQDNHTTFLLTDAGIKYPVPDEQTQAALGYGDTTRTPVLDGIAAQIPTGPSLSATAALDPQAQEPPTAPSATPVSGS
jgi:hypothetical protein